ncbi:pol-like protein [Alternaria alternata]|nr:pol-like protein [Alternaria alternata]
MALAGLFRIVVDVGTWPSPPWRCDERGNRLLLVEIAHLLAPQCLVGFLPRGFVCPVVLVDVYWYWFAWLAACSLRDGPRRGQSSNDVRVVLPNLLLDGKKECLHVKRDP